MTTLKKELIISIFLQVRALEKDDNFYIPTIDHSEESIDNFYIPTSESSEESIDNFYIPTSESSGESG